MEPKTTQPKAKQEWLKPELVILVRSKPEEVVLGVCKRENVTGPNFGQHCNVPTPCNVLSPS
ncbi:MAG: hypothetical protein ACE5GO_06800 [Anaerolineales bacterium]